MPTVAQRYEQMMEMREHPAPSFIEEGVCVCVCVCVWPNRAERRRQFKMLLRSVKRAMRRG